MPKKASMDMTPGKIKERVKKKEEALSSYFQRMDDDYDLWNLKKYIFDKHKGCINLTSNKPRTFCDKLQSILIAAPMDIQIKMPALDAPLQPQEVLDACNRLEALFKFGFNKGDEHLRRLDQVPSKDSYIWCGLVRGRIATRVLVYREGDTTVFRITPLDPRWLTYEVSDQGLLWVAYKVFKTPEAIYHDYGVGMAESDEKPQAVIDFWGMDKGIVKNTVIGEKDVLKKPTPHGVSRIPIVTVPVSTRPQIIDSTGILQEGHADSVLAPMRDAYRERDRLRSLVATQASTHAKAPLIHYYDPQNPSKLEEPTFYPGSIIDVPKTEELKEYPLKDTSHAVLTILSDLTGEVQEATIADVDVGRVGSPPPSGTAIQELKQAIEKALGPCGHALSYVYTDACKLMYEQIREGGFEIPVELAEGNKYLAFDITAPELPDKYYVNVTFTPIVPYKQMENYQIGEMAIKLGISPDTVWEEFLHFQDIRAEHKRASIHSARQLVPHFSLVEAVEALEEQGRNKEAQIVKDFLMQQGYQGYAGAMDAEQRIKGNQAMLGQQMMGQPPQGAPPQGMPPPQGAPQGAPPQEVR